MKNINGVIPNSAQKTWDEELKQNYVEYADGANKKQIWVEDLESLKAKVSLIVENKLAGVASWQKGMESDGVWKMFQQELELK